MKTFPPAIFLMGPTASGKTGVALEVAKRFPCDIVSVDSTQVYRGMDIGTAKPSPHVLRQVPHRLVDIRDPAEAYSAAEFRDDALREMAQISAGGRVPLLVGGTMLYFRVLQLGLSPLPRADAGVRRRILALAGAVGWAGLHERIREIDPPSAARIHPNDRQRIQRALEVYEIEGKTWSELCLEPAPAALSYRLIKIALVPARREDLHARIEGRFDHMLAQGLVKEVAGFYHRGDLDVDLPAMRAVGYRQVWNYLAGNGSYDQMRDRAIAATRQFAKRQLTWLRSEGHTRWFDSGASNPTAAIISYLKTVFNEISRSSGI